MTTPALYTDLALTKVCIGPSSNNYIINDILPSVTAKTQTGFAYRLDNEGVDKNQDDDIRSESGEATVIELKGDHGPTFFCIDHAFDGYVSDAQKAQAEAEIQPAINRVKQLTDRLNLRKEIRGVAALVAGCTTTAAASNKFDNLSGAKSPIEMINEKIVAMGNAAGVIPNGIAMDWAVFNAIMQHPDTRGRYNATVNPLGMAGLDAQANMLAALLGINKVSVAKIARKNTAVRGQTASYSAIWSDNLLIYYQDGITGETTQGVGCTVTWNTGTLQGGGGYVNGFRVRKSYDEKRESDWYRVGLYYDLKVLNALSGSWLTDCLT